MSTYQQKPNTGSLFRNDRKESDTHPDYKGSALIDGLGDCWLDAWINTAKDGTKYMSLKIKAKDAQRGPVEDGKGNVFDRNAPEPIELDDDVPF